METACPSSYCIEFIRMTCVEICTCEQTMHHRAFCFPETLYTGIMLPSRGNKLRYMLSHSAMETISSADRTQNGTQSQLVSLLANIYTKKSFLYTKHIQISFLVFVECKAWFWAASIIWIVGHFQNTCNTDISSSVQ